MEAVASHTLVIVPPRQPERLHHVRLRPMECGIETRHLRQMRRVRGDGADRRQVVRLVQRGQRHQRVEFRQHRIIHPHGGSEVHAAMHDAVTDSRDLLAAHQAANDLHQFQRRCLMVQAVGRPCLLGHSFTRRVVHLQRWGDADRLHLAAKLDRPILQPMDGELDTGGASVEDSDAVVHSFLTR